jgi:hypothetical protein
LSGQWIDEPSARLVRVGEIPPEIGGIRNDGRLPVPTIGDNWVQDCSGPGGTEE